VEEARKWVGTTYRLGGSSSSEIDCSGLTMRVYEKFGEKVPYWDEKHSTGTVKRSAVSLKPAIWSSSMSIATGSATWA
jgi:hypothetical protein